MFEGCKEIPYPKRERIPEEEPEEKEQKVQQQPLQQQQQQQQQQINSSVSTCQPPPEKRMRPNGPTNLGPSADFQQSRPTNAFNNNSTANNTKNFM